jgi:DNA-binding response OmpR family regulator
VVVAGLLKVLHVDDDPAAIRFVAAVLTAAGFAVSSASSLDEAVVLAEKVIPDLLLLDLQLPSGDGLMVARAVKAQAATSHAAVAFLTGIEEGERYGIAATMGPMIAKPVEIDALAEVVGRLARQGRQRLRSGTGSSPR